MFCQSLAVKNWLLGPGTSSQSERYSSKWLVWLMCGEPLVCILLLLQTAHVESPLLEAVVIKCSSMSEIDYTVCQVREFHY